MLLLTQNWIVINKCVVCDDANPEEIRFTLLNDVGLT